MLVFDAFFLVTFPDVVRIRLRLNNMMGKASSGLPTPQTSRKLQTSALCPSQCQDVSRASQRTVHELATSEAYGRTNTTRARSFKAQDVHVAQSCTKDKTLNLFEAPLGDEDGDPAFYPQTASFVRAE